MCFFTTDIAQIESQHASTRRLITLKSVQVARPDVDRISAEWVCRNNYIRRTEARGPTDPTHEGESSGTKKPPKKPATWGWAWRAFVSERLAGEAFNAENMGRLSEEYAALPQEQRDYYEMLGRVAQASAERGFQALPKHQPARTQQLAVAQVSGETLTAGLHDSLAELRRTCNVEAREQKGRVQQMSEELAALDMDERDLQPVAGTFPEFTSGCSTMPAQFAQADVHLPGDLMTQAALDFSVARRNGLKDRVASCVLSTLPIAF